MHARRQIFVHFTAMAVAAMLTACGDATVAGPASKAPSAPVTSKRAIQQHVEFDAFDSFDIQLSCMNGETTHWEGTVHVTIDVVTTSSGVVNTRFAVVFDPTYFVERENGVRYYPVAGFPVHEHHTDGPLTLIAGTAAGVFKSEDGDTLPLGFHVQALYDRNGNAVVDWKFTGVCP